MSYPEWKREATIPQILFGLRCPYGKPSSPVARFFWRRRIWIEATFALSMMEPWERFIVMYVVYAILLALAFAAFFYLPHHLSFLHGRAAYYLYGSDAAGAADSLIRLRDAASSFGSKVLSRATGSSEL
ncbi:uncharacterized protein TRAVEDRAFT_119988 [Trametes versicolor FP-101664 SS1]|uniref:uncharacterized protein n=1 Tax=Trametes versicolor (strain FP-101664) TaxID=717944 RepID=UPI000462128C|nr:uncharacterized protein TRAVEDRAFT_119988 [Trametes versicolor FP-101664 SS1]EIW60067.1 hypothetical protein TRAVEDRAFT_119988 [Trametes versicolor FP-101664 SS1]